MKPLRRQWMRAHDAGVQLECDRLLLRRAVHAGLLRIGHHYRHALSSGELLYNIGRIRPLMLEIRALRQRPSKAYICREWTSEHTPVDTDAKKKIAIDLSVLYVQMREIEKVASETFHMIQEKEREFWFVLWERKDCPICGGSGTLDVGSCQFCDEPGNHPKFALTPLGPSGAFPCRTAGAPSPSGRLTTE